MHVCPTACVASASKQRPQGTPASFNVQLPIPPTPQNDALLLYREQSKNGILKDGVVKTKPRVERNRVLVTGGAGFVGSHLCEYLVNRGDQVRGAVDRIPRRCAHCHWQGALAARGALAAAAVAGGGWHRDGHWRRSGTSTRATQRVHVEGCGAACIGAAGPDPGVPECPTMALL